MYNFLKPLAFVLTALPLACGPGEEPALSGLKAGPPDLRFSGVPVQVLLPSASSPIPVVNGGTFHVPCNTGGFRAKYRYENIGQSAAAAHTNVSGIAGGASYPFSQLALGASTLRYAYASFGAVAAPNVETKLSIKLDGPGAGVVSEVSEGNNTWVAKVVRDCP